MTRNPVIIDIGGNLENRFGFDFQLQEFYIKKNKNAVNMTWSMGGMATALTTVMMGGLYNFYNTISPVNWLSLTTIILIVMSFVVIRFAVYVTDHFVNYKIFEKLNDIGDIRNEKLKDLKI